MCRHDETLPSGDEDARRLVPLHAAEEHVDGVCQAGEVSEALRRVEGQQLRVLQGEGHGKWRGRGELQKKRVRVRESHATESNMHSGAKLNMR